MKVTPLSTIVALTVVLILWNYSPAFGMLFRAATSGLVRGISLTPTAHVMTDGAQGIIPAVLSICAAGVLARTLIQSGAAGHIANTIIDTFGDKIALLAIGFSATVLTAVRIFIDISVITIGPVVLAIGQRLSYHRLGVLLITIGCRAAVSSSVFDPTLLQLGVSRLFAGVMIHAGAPLGDMPYGGFFHSNAGPMDMQGDERLRLLQSEMLVGATLTIASIFFFGILHIS